jgi:hypothetical protein
MADELSEVFGLTQLDNGSFPETFDQVRSPAERYKLRQDLQTFLILLFLSSAPF